MGTLWGRKGQKITGSHPPGTLRLCAAKTSVRYDRSCARAEEGMARILSARLAEVRL